MKALQIMSIFHTLELAQINVDENMDDNYKQIVKGIRAGPAGLGRSFSNSGQRVSLPNR